MSDQLATLLQDEDNALRSIVWMAEEAGMQLPPIPESYLDSFIEIIPGISYATDPALARVLSTYDLDKALMSGNWPVTGMAFRLVPVGRFLQWQLVLAGRVHLIQMTLSADLTGPEDKRLRLQPISTANDQLARYLTDEVNLARYLASGPVSGDEMAQIIRVSNVAGGLTRETHRSWSANAGLGPVRNDEVIFTYRPVPPPAEAEEVLLHL